MLPRVPIEQQAGVCEGAAGLDRHHRPSTVKVMARQQGRAVLLDEQAGGGVRAPVRPHRAVVLGDVGKVAPPVRKSAMGPTSRLWVASTSHTTNFSSRWKSQTSVPAPSASVGPGELRVRPRGLAEEISVSRWWDRGSRPVARSYPETATSGRESPGRRCWPPRSRSGGDTSTWWPKSWRLVRPCWPSGPWWIFWVVVVVVVVVVVCEELVVVVDVLD